MKKLFFLSIIMILSSCSSNYKRVIVQPYSCYVKWNSSESKKLYRKGFGKSQASKAEKNLTFSLAENDIVIVREKLKDNKYITVLNLSDAGREKIKEVEDKFYDPSGSLIQELSNSQMKLSKKEIQKLVSDFDPVDCNQYMSSSVSY